MAEYREKSWAAFVAANEDAAKSKRSIRETGSPKRLAGLTLETLAKRVGYDATKIEAVRAAIKLRDTDTVTDKDGAAKRSLMVWGETSGAGKTGCLVAVLEAWQAIGRNCVFVRLHDLVEEIKSGFGSADNASSKALNRAKYADVLLLDEFGNPSREMSGYMHDIAKQIIWHRHADDLPTLITSNFTPDGLRCQVDQFMYRRLMEMAAFIEMGGKPL